MLWNNASGEIGFVLEFSNFRRRPGLSLVGQRPKKKGERRSAPPDVSIGNVDQKLMAVPIMNWTQS